ncbi:MAG: PAS domain-containing protein [Myxococcota bacterium]
MNSPHVSSQSALLSVLEAQLRDAEQTRDRALARIEELRALIAANRASPADEPGLASTPVIAHTAAPKFGVISSQMIQANLGAPIAPDLATAAQSRQLPVAGLSSVDVGKISQLSAAQLDGLAYGVIRLDARGRVLAYNDTESRMAGLPKDQVIGRNFFADLAPCTRVKEFEGRFRDFVNVVSNLTIESFEFVFRFERGHQRVLIIFTPARYRGQFQVAILRR